TFGSCGLNLPVHIKILENENLLGPDTTLLYCPGEEAIDIGPILSVQPGWSTSITPAMHNGPLIFTPGMDSPGAYELDVGTDGGCTDTALITFQETPEQELAVDDIELCEGQEKVIGL